MDRRSLLKLLALAPLASTPLLVGRARAGAVDGAARARKLVLVELQGGNDGLNTVVPIGDARYRKLRPTLALDDKSVLGVGGGLALHPALAQLGMENGDVAIVLGVGYPRPVRSHFRSSDIWSTGSGADVVRTDGWIARALPRGRGLVVAGDPGPLDGPGFAALAADGDKPSRRTERPASNHALEHLARVHDDVKGARADIDRVLEGQLSPRAVEGKAFAEQVRVAARAIEGLDVAVVKLTLRGFDTHVGQRDPHARLLEELAGGLADLRARLRASGAWNDVVVVTTSEFGRRAKENASGGTDHGTAAPLFVLGGRVKGGLVGTQPRLDDLDEEGDVKLTTDYRAVLGGVARLAWGIDAGLGTPPLSLG